MTIWLIVDIDILPKLKWARSFKFKGCVSMVYDVLSEFCPEWPVSLWQLQNYPFLLESRSEPCKIDNKIQAVLNSKTTLKDCN